MMSSTDEILETALTLSEPERASLALRILESLEPTPDNDDDTYDEQLAELVASRLQELRSGALPTMDGPTVIASLRRELRG